MDSDDVRASSPICSPADVAQLVGMPVSTVYSWMRATETRPALIHTVSPERRGWPSIPLVGLAEASVLRGFREGGMPMREISAAVKYLRGHHGEYALAAPGLVTDGLVAMLHSEEGLLTLRDGQGVLVPAVREQLRPFTLAPDGYVKAFMVRSLPGVEIDPLHAAGRMRFTRTGVPLFAVTGLLEVGDTSAEVADEFGLEVDEVELVKEHLSWLSASA